MKYFLILLAFLSFSAVADLPYQPTFNWTAPTEFSDSSALDPLNDLSGYRLKCTGAVILDSVMPNDVVTWTAPVGMFLAGDYACVMTSIATNEYGGAESADSNPVNFTISQKSPNPIVDFGVR